MFGVLEVEVCEQSVTACRAHVHVLSMTLSFDLLSAYSFTSTIRLAPSLGQAWISPTTSSTLGHRRRRQADDKYKRVLRNLSSRRYLQRPFHWQNGKRIRR